jgi:3-methylcrotonyl-CoA carboxylase alpha subunit
MFTKILIANRGEIACRVAATAKRLGIKTVAVYSDADANAKHVAACDQAFRLGAAAAKDSYLKGDAIIAIAKQVGAQAIHPGYGFLSENEGFAKACEQAGLVFIGPPASAIAAMGSKSAAKALMEKAHVPLVPGYHGHNQEADFLHAQADKIGYPVLIKASAGGGGKGMRTVTQSSEFLAALTSCKREAINAFGDDNVLIERYVIKPRHIEIQVFADQHGSCVYLHERDCSVQRRHQKVVEEAPAPGLSAARRKAMGEAACAAANAVGYVGAGTVEFICAPNGDFFFMEMNTRLQVEHPVTEMITGYDLVQWQFEVAMGKPLPAKQSELTIHGHAIEARIYAENPEKGFLPSVGYLAHLKTPAADNFVINHQAIAAGQSIVRIDSGVRSGDTISAFYDPMIAKLIVWGADRAKALAAMSDALAQFEVIGPSTNVNFLGRLMSCPSFAQGDLDTSLIETEKALLLPSQIIADDNDLYLAVAALIAQERISETTQASRSFVSDPFNQQDGWRGLVPLQRQLVLQAEGERRDVIIQYASNGYSVQIAGNTEVICLADLQLLPGEGSGYRLSGLLGSFAFSVGVHFSKSRLGEQQIAVFAKHHSQWKIMPAVVAYAKAELAQAQGAAKVLSPMPGKIIALNVQLGEVVTQGQALLVLEAMKMEHSVLALRAGRVISIGGAVGAQMLEGAVLVEIAE